jgi:hypothetical protein
MRSIYLSFFLFISVALSAQEVVTGLQFNPVVKAQYLKNQMLKSVVTDTFPVGLPFYDDFSANEVFPSSVRWIDRFAYVNTDFPVYPVDRGVATLDAINDTGSMYTNATGGPDAFIADHLTSRYIRLDSVFSPAPRSLSPADSVYLSFYYQPQGRGLAPGSSDSLVLQFLLKPQHDSTAVGDTNIYVIPDSWKRIWSDKGMALGSFNLMYGVYFKRVMIPITDTFFFKNNFRFQFYNYVSLASDIEPSWQSNCCQWNLDQVYLNYGRNLHDTVHAEIRFINRAPSLLKKYQSMPYTQFSNNPSNEMIDSLSILITNRDIIPHSVKYSYNVIQSGGSFTKNYLSPSINLLPYNQYAFGYVEYPPIPFIFPISSADSNLFVVQHTVYDQATGSSLADTITGLQPFYNYYAYDDGTPEAGYGLKGVGSQMAYRFKLNKSPDTVRAVRMYFNHTLTKANVQVFYLTLWNDNSGLPGDTIYSRQVLPEYSDSLNKFTEFRLEKPVKVSGAFYVGAIQTTDDNLNFGLDTYDDAAANLFFNVTGTWLASSIIGAPMIRPVIGKPLPLGIPTLTTEKERILVYPNPCTTGEVEVALDGSDHLQNMENWSFSISALTGQVVKKTIGNNILNVSGLNPGVYFIETQNSITLQRFVTKLVIMK